MFLAGLSLGFALATKPNGLLAALLLGLLFVLVIGRAPRMPLSRLVSDLALFAGVTLLPFMPWLLKNWHQTGNPFYPLLGDFFPARNASVIDAASFVGFGVLEKRHLLYGESLWQILGLPLRIFISGQDDNPQYFDGVLTPILLLLLPWAFKGKWSDEKKLIAFFAFGYLALGLVSDRHAHPLHSSDRAIVGAVNGLWHFQYVSEYQAAAFAVRYIAFFRGLAWSLSLAVCAGQPAVQVPERK